MGPTDLAAAVRTLFDPPYHRVPFLQAGPIRFGFGGEGERWVAVFESSREETIVTSPADGSAAVPTKWDGLESPNPLRLYPDPPSNPGYPLVVAACGLRARAYRFASFSLTTSGQPVDGYFNTPDNDPNMKGACCFIPKAPLKPNVLYEATLTGSDPDGKPLTRMWRFTTGS